ncbi:unnamed protein product [Soboliphyme baturini]|uniref:N_BRCA1_IG domain-containing protein n=1 Tax=Soboliphyme baturini TaxID=241478 RepID=A0A183J1W6_9BILA|nr:unnamed protein product [Soboliphyme baturini]
MDVDMEVEGKLLQQFCCMGTYDREVLVEKFQQIVGPDANLSPDSCRFFLDMNNWNLPAALGSYYDFNAQELVSLPSVSFLNDITIGDGESVPPHTRFNKLWRICNSGTNPWPEGCKLRHVGGERLADESEVSLHPLSPKEVEDISVPMTSPAENGIYQSQWQMVTSQGIPVGGQFLNVGSL